MKTSIYTCDGCGKKTEEWPSVAGWYVLQIGKTAEKQEWHICSDGCLVRVVSSIASKSPDIGELQKGLLWGAEMCMSSTLKDASEKEALSYSDVDSASN